MRSNYMLLYATIHTVGQFRREDSATSSSSYRTTRERHSADIDSFTGVLNSVHIHMNAINYIYTMFHMYNTYR